MAADWHELMITQRTMWSSIAHISELPTKSTTIPPPWWRLTAFNKQIYRLQRLNAVHMRWENRPGWDESDDVPFSSSQPVRHSHFVYAKRVVHYTYRQHISLSLAKLWKQTKDNIFDSPIKNYGQIFIFRKTISVAKRIQWICICTPEFKKYAR